MGMGKFFQDLKHGARMLAKSPGFTSVAVLTLALGIGANTAIFTVVNGVLLRPLPFRDPSRLVIIAEQTKYPTITTSYLNYIDWRDQSHSFESMEATQFTNLTLTGLGEPERFPARRADSFARCHACGRPYVFACRGSGRRPARGDD
jgi:MacB-like periplasmic core domain